MASVKKHKIELERLCKFCEHAVALNSPDEMLCRKRGVVSAGYCCRAFRYDPLKRDPGTPLKIPSEKLPDLEEL